jgi:predicted transcriptional regulator of viral defense system
MGRIKHLGKIREFLKETPVFTTRDIRVITKNSNYSYVLIGNMIKKGEIKRIKKGFYTIHDDPMLSVFCFRPSYIGLQSALSIHNLWEQETNVVIVTSSKARTNLREVFGNNVVVHRIKPQMLFGYDLVKYGEFHLPVSDMEKTLIDLIYFNQNPSRDVIKNIRRKINAEKFMMYLKPYPRRIRARILKASGLKA